MARVMIGITVQRRLIVVPIADVEGCIVPEPDDCCPGSGSGSGSGADGCVVFCGACPDGMAQVWQVNPPGVGNSVLVYRVENPDDGNACRFASLDLIWDLRYEEQSEVWVLTKNIGTQDETVWVSDSFGCYEENEFVSDTADPAFVEPAEDCLSYDCIDGNCVQAPGITGQYTTLDECNNACGVEPIQTDCCNDPVSAALTLELSGCTCRPDPIQLVYNAAGTNGAGWYSAALDCAGHPQYFRFYCDAGAEPDPVWRLEQYCDGVLAGQGSAAAGECDFGAGVTGICAFNGSCCELSPTFTVTAP